MASCPVNGQCTFVTYQGTNPYKWFMAIFDYPVYGFTRGNVCM